MSGWVPVISGVVHRPVETRIVPRIGESVTLPVYDPGHEMELGEKTFRVIDVRHYIAYKGRASFEDVHLEEIK